VELQEGTTLAIMGFHPLAVKLIVVVVVVIVVVVVVAVVISGSGEEGVSGWYGEYLMVRHGHSKVLPLISL